MVIMPLIDLFVTACEWLPRCRQRRRAGLWLFLLLSFVNGCVLEIGRKLYAPENERAGVETYSALLGPRSAAVLWAALLALAYGLLVGVGVAVGAPRHRLAGLAALSAWLAALATSTALREPGRPAAQKARRRAWPASGCWSAMASPASRRCWSRSCARDAARSSARARRDDAAVVGGKARGAGGAGARRLRRAAVLRASRRRPSAATG